MSLNFPPSLIGQRNVGGSFDPESNLVLTAEYVPSTLIGGYARVMDAVLACELTVPSSAVGLIWEFGGTGTGAYAGFRNDNSFVIRGGSGAYNEPTTNTNEGMTIIRLTAGEVSGTGTLVIEYRISGGRIRVWWNGSLLAQAVSPNGVFHRDEWAGSNDGGYYASGGGNLASGEVSLPLQSSNRSNLRYYENQLISS